MTSWNQNPLKQSSGCAKMDLDVYTPHFRSKVGPAVHSPEVSAPAGSVGFCARVCSYSIHAMTPLRELGHDMFCPSWASTGDKRGALVSAHCAIIS